MSQNQNPKISIVVAIIKGSNAIGEGPNLLVHISDDLKRFKAITLGHPIILGRKTFESIGKALPGRKNFVVTRNPDFKALPDIVVCHTLEEAIEKACAEEMAGLNENKEIFLIGGGEIYKQGISKTDRLYLTLVDANLKGDIFFPDYSDFKKILKQEDRIDPKTGYKYSWINLER